MSESIIASKTCEAIQRAINSRIDEADKKLDSFDKAINGNGKNGLKTEVAIMKRSQKTTNGLLMTIIAMLIGMAIYIIRTGIIQ